MRWLLPALVAIVGLAACSDGGSDDDVSYALLHDDRWELQEAVDPPGDEALAADPRLPPAWFAEYVRYLGNTSELVTISGHDLSVGDVRDELRDGGYEFVDVEVADWGAASATDDEATILVLQHGDGAVVVLSYELDLHALVELAAHVDPVSEEEWTDALRAQGDRDR